MPTLEVTHLSKAFGSTQAVTDICFTVEQGEIFGLLGPNGAGKTTTIRIVLDLFKPDCGQVSILGGPMSEAKKARIGYMPEERGLYQDIPLERGLLYLAGLKGVTPETARQRLDEYLPRFDLAACRRKKVKELSKGMQQKAQIISTILHQPELLIVDEPFAGLDPVNIHMVMELLNELRSQGVTIIMSTHQMHQVEELCDRILLINHGRVVLYGSLEEVRQRFAGREVWVNCAGDLSKIAGVRQLSSDNHATRLALAENACPQDVLQALVDHQYPVKRFEIAIPSLDEIFVQVVGQEKE
jgi:ABC-2 type transport system ATP-binding protein